MMTINDFLRRYTSLSGICRQQDYAAFASKGIDFTNSRASIVGIFIGAVAHSDS